ncbi:hypothetical protein J3R83DRAFT_3658 [Lanmaoa asiatica]|nr:hypothetical protein J3R83DRAFT_3658 [Lanmaoa asiatica]
MDSQLTLIDTRSLTPPGDDITLIFDRDDMRNTTLRIRNDYLPSYLVDTHDNITTVYAGDALLATVTRRRFRRDQITFPGLRPMDLGGWLKAPILSPLPLVIHAHGRRLEWSQSYSGRLELHESGHPNDTLAWFSKSLRDHRNYVTRAACLTIKPEMDEMRDIIVLSCLLAEQKLRVIDVISAEQRKVVMHSMTFIL